MKRREIVRAAKAMVAHSGPFNVIEFGDEIFASYTTRDDSRWAYRDQIIEEAVRQAYRVLDFLGDLT